MPQRLTEHFPQRLDLAVLRLKDGMREVRHQIRSHRQPPSELRLPFGVGLPGLSLAGRPADPIRHTLAAVDDALSLAERVALRAVRGGGSEGAEIAGLERYFGPDQATPGAAERAFRQDFYGAARKSAALAGIGANGLREQTVARVWQRVRRDIGETFAPLQRKPRFGASGVGGICASLLVAFLVEGAGRSNDDGGEADRIVALFAAPVLASGLLTLKRQPQRGADLMQSCRAAVEARRERLARSLRAPDAQAELAGELAFLLRHLP